MSALYACPACNDCDSRTIPTVEFDDCNPKVHESEITDIYFAKEDPLNPGQPATGSIDWSSAAAIEAAFNGTNGFRITVVGDKPPAEPNQRVISKRRTVNGKKKFTINADIDETNDTNYEAMRKLECGGEWFFWYVILGAKVYGGPLGIKGNVADADDVLERGEGSFERFPIVLNWYASCNPPRTDYALAENNAIAA